MNDEGKPGEAPSRLEHKEARRDGSKMAAYHLRSLCCSALDLASFKDRFFCNRREALGCRGFGTSDIFFFFLNIFLSEVKLWFEFPAQISTLIPPLFVIVIASP